MKNLINEEVVEEVLAEETELVEVEAKKPGLLKRIRTSADAFAEKHPKLAKAVKVGAIGGTIVGAYVVGEKTGFNKAVGLNVIDLDEEEGTEVETTEATEIE